MKALFVVLGLIQTSSFAYAAPVSDRTVVSADAKTTSIYLYGAKGSQASKLFDALTQTEEEDATGTQGASRSRIRTGKDIECAYEYATSHPDIKLVYACTIRVNARSQ